MYAATCVKAVAPHLVRLLLPALMTLLVSACGGPEGSLGERIYLTGEGRDGSVVYSQGPRWLSHGRFGCATCHATDGAGRFVKTGQAAGAAPAITAAVLAARGYDAATLSRAIRDGVAADGRVFSYYMPRWQLDATEMQALLSHLERL